MPITTVSLGPWETNSHILYNSEQAVVVDVGDDPAPILAFLREKRLTLSHICITHWHCDHVYGVRALQQATSARTFLPAGDSYLKNTADAVGGDGWPLVEEFDFEPYPARECRLAGFDLQVLDTPGHTRGGISLYCPAERAVFSGDTLFCRGVGRTDFLGGDAQALRNSIYNVLFKLPPDVVVYSGHGPDTTIMDEQNAMSGPL